MRPTMPSYLIGCSAMALTLLAAASTASALTLGSAGTWKWYDIPGTQCAKGGSSTPTGMAINPSDVPTNTKILIFMDSGGACTDANSCLGPFKTATRFTYAKADWDLETAATAESVNLASPLNSYTWSKPVGSRGIFDRSNPNNPFQHYHYVFIPYCTADQHSGSRFDSSSAFPLVRAASFQYFMGYKNFGIFAGQIKATFQSPQSITLTGSSAGGAGALFNYPQLRAQYPSSVAITTISDGGTPLWTGDDTTNLFDYGPRPGFLMLNWVTVMYPLGCNNPSTCNNWNYSYFEDWTADAWGLDATRYSRVSAVTRIGAQRSMYPVQTALLAMATDARNNFPNDRFALVDSTEDWLMPYFYHLNITHPNPPKPNFNMGLIDLRAAIGAAGLNNIIKTFFVASTVQFNSNFLPYNQWHTFLWSDASLWANTGNGFGLGPWLATSFAL